MPRLILMTDFSEGYANFLLKGIVRYSHEHTPWVMCKMPLSLRDSHRMDEVVDFAVNWSADAIIGQFNPDDNVDIFKEKGIIAIAQDYQVGFPQISNIRGDYALCGRIGADYFIKRGVRNFGFYGIKGMVWSDGRREGFIKEIKEKVKDCTIDVLDQERLTDTWWYDLSRLTGWLVSLPKPVAIMSCDDNRAYQIVEACQSKRNEGLRIPQDIMLLGVDNDEALCQLCSPTLSSLGQDVEQAGYNVAKMIDGLLELPPEERFSRVRDIPVMPTFVVSRHSTEAYAHPNPYISKALSCIYGNLGSPVNVGDIVKHVPMSRRLLEKTFKKEMGTSIYQYIINARVEKMKDLMRNGLSALEATDELNVDYKVIARNFKHVTGMTPCEYARTLSR